MTKLVNPKIAAWDLLGSQFWAKGRATARPTMAEIGIFLEELPTGSCIGVVGASTKDLIEAAVARRVAVTVFDFSTRMCSDLRASIASTIDTRILDITAAIPADLRGQYDAVLSDRLINRFTRSETVSALAGMLSLLRRGGTWRTSVKLGFYPMDNRMIDEGKRRKTLPTFYDEATRTIDFCAAGDVLDTCLLPHGDIAPNILLAWYRGRGRESRFDHEDILSLAAEIEANGKTLQLNRSFALPHAKETTYYEFKAIA
jgi:hypothetical protein